MTSAYRTYDADGRPVGFDWQLALVRLGGIVLASVCTVGALGAVVTIYTWATTPATPEPLPPCHDEVLNGWGRCSHSDQVLYPIPIEGNEHDKKLRFYCMCESRVCRWRLAEPGLPTSAPATSAQEPER